jgi:hypothetical protein
MDADAGGFSDDDDESPENLRALVVSHSVPEMLWFTTS